MSLSRSKNSWKERQAAAPELSAAERASKLFDQARQASKTQSSGVKSDLYKRRFHHHKSASKADPFDAPLPNAIASSSSGRQNEDEQLPSKPVSLHDLLKLLTSAPVAKVASVSLTTPAASSVSPLTMREAMPIAGKLFSKGYNTTDKLAKISLTLLKDIGIEGEEARKKTVRAIKGDDALPKERGQKRSVAQERGKGNDPAADSPRKRARRDVSPGSLGREWGDMGALAKAKRPGVSELAEEGVTYAFNEVLDESALKGKYVMVNRAPIMTAWATVVLEKLGFERDEALSLAHCYVNNASTARGVAIGVLPSASTKEKELSRVGTNQPHFELMRMRIPVMQLQNGAYRGISKGEIIGPEKAWNYMRNAMFQTLPLVMGALYLLAESYIEFSEEADSDIQADTTAEKLHVLAYPLYTEFRPDTDGVWGKKARLEIDKILNLRKHVVAAKSQVDEAELISAKEEPDPEAGFADLEEGVQESEEESGRESNVVGNDQLIDVG